MNNFLLPGKTYYEKFGIAEDASLKEIKKAYRKANRKLALKSGIKNPKLKPRFTGFDFRYWELDEICFLRNIIFNVPGKFSSSKNRSQAKREEIFKEINNIYEILSDTISRREYDTALKIKRENIKNKNDFYAAHKRRLLYHKSCIVRHSSQKKDGFFERRNKREKYDDENKEVNNVSYTLLFIKNILNNLGPIGTFLLIMALFGIIYNDLT